MEKIEKLNLIRMQPVRTSDFLQKGINGSPKALPTTKSLPGRAKS